MSYNGIGAFMSYNRYPTMRTTVEIRKRWERMVANLMCFKDITCAAYPNYVDVYEQPLQAIDDTGDTVIREHSRGDKSIKCYFEKVDQVALHPYEQFVLDFNSTMASLDDWQKLDNIIDLCEYAWVSKKLPPKPSLIRRIYDYIRRIL